MKRKFAALFLASVVATSSVPVMGADVNLSIDGLVQANAGTVINSNGYNLLGMREVFELLGASVKWNGDKRLVTANKGDTTVELYVDTNKALVNGEYVKMPTGCVNLDGHIYVPIRFVSDAFGCKIDWDMATHKISIDTGNEKYTLLNVSAEVTDDTKVISYNEALQMAIDRSSDLKNVEDSVDYLDEMRDDLGDLMWSLDQQSSIYNANLFDLSQKTDDILAAQLAVQQNVESVIEAARSIKNVEIQKSMIGVNEEMVKDGVELALKSYLNNIKATRTQIQLLSEKVELGKENISNLELKNKLGYESDYSLQSAKTTQLSDESNLKMLTLNLENQKQALKTLLGVDASEDIYVEADVTFNALTDVSLETYVDRMRETDLSIKSLKNAVTIAEYKGRTNAAYDSESEIAVRNEGNTAKRNLADAQDNLEKNIRSTYNNIKQLEETNTNLLRAVEQAKADYNSAVTSYRAGMATEYQVKMAKLGILSAEKDVEDNARTYDLMTYAFDKPYLLSSVQG